MAVGLTAGCSHAVRMDEGLRRARNHNQRQAAQRWRQRLFFGLSGWRCDPKAAKQLEVPGHQATKRWTRLDQ